MVFQFNVMGDVDHVTAHVRCKRASSLMMPCIMCVTFYRTRYHTCLHLALLCICDMCALDATDRDALMAWDGLLFMVIVTFCLYNTHCVDNDRYYTRSVMVCVCVGPQEMMSYDVITGQLLYDEGGVKPRGVVVFKL
jgi:hypothetical protein